jgi:hypothetical protein
MRMCERCSGRGKWSLRSFLWRGLGRGYGGCRSLVFRGGLLGRGRPVWSISYVVGSEIL